MMKKGQNFNHPKKGSRIEVGPIRNEKDIKSILQLLSGKPRNLLLFTMGINNGIRAGDLLNLKVEDDLNFRSLRRVGDAMELCGGGIDHCFVIDDYSVSSNNRMRKAAELQSTSSGRIVRVFTDAPAVQLYTGNAIRKETGLDGVEYFQHAGLCLKTQNYPDAVNQLMFPNPFIEPNTLYQSTTMYAFSFV